MFAYMHILCTNFDSFTQAMQPVEYYRDWLTIE